MGPRRVGMLAGRAAEAAQVLAAAAFSSEAFGSATFLPERVARIVARRNQPNLLALFVQLKIQGG